MGSGRIGRPGVVQQTQDIAGKVDTEPVIMVGVLGIDRSVGRIVEDGSETGVEVALVGIPHERIALGLFAEIRIDIEHPDDVGLDREELEEEAGTHRTAVSEGPGDDGTGILRPVLVVERGCHVRFRNRAAGREEPGRDPEEFRECDAG